MFLPDILFSRWELSRSGIFLYILTKSIYTRNLCFMCCFNIYLYGSCAHSLSHLVMNHVNRFLLNLQFVHKNGTVWDTLVHFGTVWYIAYSAKV